MQLSKSSINVPVPKTSNITCLNDNRPVAQTPVIMKRFQKILLKPIIKDIIVDKSRLRKTDHAPPNVNREVVERVDSVY